MIITIIINQSCIIFSSCILLYFQNFNLYTLIYLLFFSSLCLCCPVSHGTGFIICEQSSIKDSRLPFVDLSFLLLNLPFCLALDTTIPATLALPDSKPYLFHLMVPPGSGQLLPLLWPGCDSQHQAKALSTCKNHLIYFLLSGITVHC